MNVDLPVWANQAINESCQSKAWNNLIENIKENLKNSNKIRKRFSNYTEAEQALLVEEELKLVREIFYIFTLLLFIISHFSFINDNSFKSKEVKV